MKMKNALILFSLILIISFSSNAQLKIISGFEGGSYHQMAKELKGISSQPIDVLTSKGSRDNFFALRNSGVGLEFYFPLDTKKSI